LEKQPIKDNSQDWSIVAQKFSKMMASKAFIKGLESLFWESLLTELSISGKNFAI